MNNLINLESERIWLREYKWKDVNSIHQLHADPEVAKYNTLGIPKDLSQTRDVIKPVIDDQDNPVRLLFGWSILHFESQEFMGEAGMRLAAPRFKRAEVSYSLLPKFWGQGYATEMLKTLISFGFEGLELHRIDAGVAVDNEKSIKLLERVGMQREGRGRKILPLSRGWSDNYTYSILAEDPREY